jgi:para-aminobenzoate synthetase component I
MRYQLRYVRAPGDVVPGPVQDSRSSRGASASPQPRSPRHYGSGVVDARPTYRPSGAYAWVGDRLARDLLEVRQDLQALDEPGFWVAVGTFEGVWTCARFARVEPAPLPSGRRWSDIPVTSWSSSMSAAQYQRAVDEVRERVAAGEVYQVNLCRVLSAPVPPDADLATLAVRLAAGNPARYAARVWLPEADLDIVSASPELFLAVSGERVSSAPIKGTGRVPGDLAPKDVAENVMIVDLVRNDLGRVCHPGSIVVDDVLTVEEHPGLVHLVSTVRGTLRPDVGWTHLLAAAFPPGSVSGAPKSSALRTITALEPVPRGPYCGAIGWVDSTGRREGRLAVGIRTFWKEQGLLRFGTGAGITWGSDPEREWRETQLKAARLLGLAGPDGRLP